ncbi:MAG: hypothetical protein H6Q75_496 [Firmicutes bacterium]|nr:hypothetical protein [Bacillota bacterium]
MKVIYAALFVISCLFIAMSAGNCAGYNGASMYNVADIYQETLWLSLDVSDTQRQQIDAIIASKNKDVQKVAGEAIFMLDQQKMAGPDRAAQDTKKPAGKPAPGASATPAANPELNLINYLRVLKRLDDIRNSTNEEISQCLNPEQQTAFLDSLEQRKTQASNLVAVLAGLNMDSYQQKQTIRSLLVCKQQVWITVTDTTYPWEKRLKRMQGIPALRTLYSKLNPEQRDVLDTYVLAMGQE